MPRPGSPVQIRRAVTLTGRDFATSGRASNGCNNKPVTPPLIARCIRWSAAQRFVLDDTTFVVAQPGFIVGEEHLPDEFTSTAFTRLVEDALGGEKPDRTLGLDTCKSHTVKRPREHRCPSRSIPD